MQGEQLAVTPLCSAGRGAGRCPDKPQACASGTARPSARPACHTGRMQAVASTPVQPSPSLACSSSTAWLSPISAMRRMFSAMRFCAWGSNIKPESTSGASEAQRWEGRQAGRRAGCRARHRERLMRAGRRSCWAHLALQLQLGRLGCHSGWRTAGNTACADRRCTNRRG